MFAAQRCMYRNETIQPFQKEFRDDSAFFENSSKDSISPNVCGTMNHTKIPQPDVSSENFIRQTVLIAIPTFKRSERLKELMPHVTDTLQSVHKVEILVIDNNALPIEKKSVEAFAKQSAYPVHYIHESEAGVSNARNAALRFATSRFLAFLDDDMEITKNWVDSLVSVSIDHGAGLVFGPLTAKFADDADPRNPYLSTFYTRHSKQTKAGLSNEAFGTGGCLIDLENCILPDPPFDPRQNQSGGEDDLFFESLHKSGTQYGWAPNALCYECVPPERTTSNYIAVRNFGYGQGPSRIAAYNGLKGIPQIIRHMTVGAAQLGIFGFAYIVAKIMKRPSEVRFLALSARGLGKIFWFDKFRPKLYGNSSSSS